MLATPVRSSTEPTSPWHACCSSVESGVVGPAIVSWPNFCATVSFDSSLVA